MGVYVKSLHSREYTGVQHKIESVSRDREALPLPFGILLCDVTQLTLSLLPQHDVVCLSFAWMEKILEKIGNVAEEYVLLFFSVSIYRNILSTLLLLYTENIYILTYEL